MTTTYRQIGLWFLVTILMIPLAYGQNETILIANFMNGNTNAFNSRIYLFNSSDTAGGISVRVFSLPIRSGLPQELGTPISLGVLGARSALNIKLAEDILIPLGLSPPYTNDGGNLTLEFTIGAENVRGVAQVFSGDFAFGTYPLQGPASTSEISDGAVGSAQLADQVIFGSSNSPGRIGVVNSNNTQVLTASVSGEGGLLNISNSSGESTSILGNIGDDGAFNILNSTGDLRVFLGVSNNGGRITVTDSSNTTTAGINGSTGEVFGTSKSFIVADPSDSNRMIKYTSVEGPEAAIYVRGTANLVSGQGHIDFPDHFAVMAVPSSITVSLTPRSASSMGLAAVSVSSQGIDVAELGGGTNSYSFDYVAYAVRKGFEDYEVYLTQEQVVRLTGQTQALELRPRSLLTTSPLKAIQ